VAYQKRYVRQRIAHVVYADLNSPHVKVAVATAARGIGSRDSWSRIIGRVHPTAAITGTYFDIASALPIGTIVSRGAVVHRGSIGSLLAIRPDNQVIFAYQRPGTGHPWEGYETALRAGPRLVVDGRIRLTPAWEGFRDPAVYARRPRAAVGVTRHNKLVLATVSRGVLLREMAAIMQDLGAVDALCMDGGTSACLYYRGKSYRVPGRALTNLLVVYDSSTLYRRYAPRLGPGGAIYPPGERGRPRPLRHADGDAGAPRLQHTSGPP
jgi:exopolysaccharide biosynthesis protein